MKGFFMNIAVKKTLQSFSVVVVLFTIIACSEKPAPVVDAPIPAESVPTIEATPAPAPEAAPAPAADAASEVSHSKHGKKDKEYYSSPSVESTDPAGNLSSSETYSLCSEGCSAMSNGSSDTYTDCVRACTQE